MIFLQSIHVMFQSVNCRGGHHSGLPKCSAEQLSSTPGAVDCGGIADQDRAHRTTQALRKTDRNGICKAGEVSNTVSLCRGCIEQSGSINVNLESVFVSPIPHSSHLGERPCSAPTVVGRVLNTNQSRDAVMLIVGPDLPFQVLHIEHTKRPSQ